MSFSHGPALIYDKSTIQSLSKNESDWLHHHFHIVMTSVFLIELVSNLHKDARSGFTSESQVALLSSKIPHWGFTPNIPYDVLIRENLLGNEVEMDGRPLLGGGKRVRNPAGEYGVVFEESPEAKIIRRWQQQDFTEMERDISARWKRDLETLDLRPLKQSLKSIKQKRPDIKSDKDLFYFVKDYVTNPLQAFRVLATCLDVFDVDQKFHKSILTRWKLCNRPPLNIFAPYSAYALCVELFFMFGMAFDFIADTRPKHRSDFAYLYYLPFTKIFTSSDKLHIRFAPGFLRLDQLFIDGRVLKKDLAKLLTYYEALPDVEKEKGKMNYAKLPPREGGFLVTKIYDILHPEWREYSQISEEPRTPERNAEITKRIGEWEQLIKQAKESG